MTPTLKSISAIKMERASRLIIGNTRFRLATQRTPSLGRRQSSGFTSGANSMVERRWPNGGPGLSNTLR